LKKPRGRRGGDIATRKRGRRTALRPIPAWKKKGFIVCAVGSRKKKLGRKREKILMCASEKQGRVANAKWLQYA